MSRKRRAPKKIPIVDPVYKSTIIPKLVNSIMYDGKKTIAEKIVYDALEKIKSKTKDEPINIFNDAIKNVASISANNDEEIGGLIAKAIDTVGKSGVVTVSESQDMNTTIEVVNGLDGHAQKTMSTTVYYKGGFPADVLYEEGISKLNYEGMDFENLKINWKNYI